MKIHELHDLKDTANVITLDDERGLDQMEWSEDGQLLAVSTTKGATKNIEFRKIQFYNKIKCVTIDSLI